MARIPLGLGPSLHQLRSRSLCLVRRLHSYWPRPTSHARASSATAPRLPMRTAVRESELSTDGQTSVPRISHSRIFSRRRRDKWIRRKVQSSQEASDCMLSGARRVRPVIVGCSTATRTQAIRQSLMLARCRMASSNSRRKLGHDAYSRPAPGTESSCTQSGTIQGRPRHDHWAKLGLFGTLRTHYSPVMLALFSMKPHPVARKNAENVQS